jgi:hypothetical protein
LKIPVSAAVTAVKRLSTNATIQPSIGLIYETLGQLRADNLRIESGLGFNSTDSLSSAAAAAAGDKIRLTILVISAVI